MQGRLNDLGFHPRERNDFLLKHRKHFVGLVGEDGRLEWTASARQVLNGVPNVLADLSFPIFVDRLLWGRLIAWRSRRGGSVHESHTSAGVRVARGPPA